jgi:hypothetical protein
VLYGDPAQEGMFALRIKAPKGYAIPPHTHPKPEVITVISGKFGLGMGQKADRAGTESLPAGSFSSMPPASPTTSLLTRTQLCRSMGQGLGVSITSIHEMILVST